MQRQNNPLLAPLAAPGLGGQVIFRPERVFQTRLCKFPIKKCAAGAAHLHEPRITNHEISILTIPGLAVVRLTHEYRICLNP